MVDRFSFLSFAVVNNNTNLRASTKNQFLATTKKQINFLVLIKSPSLLSFKLNLKDVDPINLFIKY